MLSLWYTCTLHVDIWMKNITDIALCKWICGHKKLKDSTKCCASLDDDFITITTVTRRYPSHGYNKFPCMHHPCLQDKDPGWPLVVQLHVAQATQEIRLTRAPTQWTKAHELCSCAPTAWHVSMSNWIGPTAKSIRDMNPFVCDKPLCMHHSCTVQQALYTHNMVNNLAVVQQSSIAPKRNECA
jgi:hypothetical protein